MNSFIPPSLDLFNKCISIIEELIDELILDITNTAQNSFIQGEGLMQFKNLTTNFRNIEFIEFDSEKRAAFT